MRYNSNGRPHLLLSGGGRNGHYLSPFKKPFELFALFSCIRTLLDANTERS